MTSVPEIKQHDFKAESQILKNWMETVQFEPHLEE